MFTSAELIAALRRRMRRSLRPERPSGEFPAGWAAWFASMRARTGSVSGATADAIIAVFLARAPRLPPAATLALNRWRAFSTLLRQQWDPAGEDERGIRVVAMSATLLVHLFFALFLMYVAYVRWIGIPEPAREGETVIQVEFIGDGTPDDAGGGPQQGEVKPDNATATPAAQAQVSAPRPAQPSPAPPLPAVAATEPPPQPKPALAPPVEQPLQLTETSVPDQVFVLPPTRIVEVPQPKMAVPDLGAPAPEIRVVELPAPVQPVAPVLPSTLPSPAIEAPELQLKPAEVAVRELPAPLPEVRIPTPQARSIPAPELSASAPAVATRSIPTPPGASDRETAASTSAVQPTSGLSPASSSRTPAGGEKTASSSGTRAATAGSGPTALPRPGALPSPKRGDDWGVSDRNRPGRQAGQPGGLLNADGTPRLAGNDGKVGGGLPPGTITEDFAKIDRNGTWLKRPPFDYTPTSFDRFWIPNETLLEEWVRRGIKEVFIPIPGTGKKLHCGISLLQLGGGCSITDPNLKDIEATARKPPDVPFKPELMEDQDSLAKPATP